MFIGIDVAKGELTPELSCGRVKQKRARSARNIHSVARQLQRTLDITVEDLRWQHL